MTKVDLTQLEIAVIDGLASGLQSKEIARNVNRSRARVESVVQALYLKLSARSRSHIVAIAFENGFLPARSLHGSRHAASANDADPALVTPDNRVDDLPHVLVGEFFTREVIFGREEIARFADMCGDRNPVHHDRSFAASTRFGDVIVSGPQTSAFFMAMVATHFAQKAPMLGLEFTFRFRGPARPEERLLMRWEVVSVEPKPKLNGSFIKLAGSIANEGGEEIVTGEGTALLTVRL